MAVAPAARLVDGRRLVRAVAVLIAGIGLALSGARVMGTRFEPVLLAPALLAVLIGWLTSRLEIVVRVIAQVVALVGSGILVAYASGGDAADFGRGLLEGPRQVVTTSWPSPRFPTIFVALAALVFIAVAASTDLAMRTRWRALAIAPLVPAMVAMIAFGAPDGPQWAPVLCAAVGAFVLLWIGFDDRVASIRAGSWIAALVGIAVLTATVAIAMTPRANPRQFDDVRRELSLLDPLSEVAAQRKVDPPAAIYEVASPSLNQLRRWRTAALDVYNGESWSTDAELAPVGSRLAAGSGAEQIPVSITALSEATVVWASPGRLLRTKNPVETDAARHVVRILGSQRPAANVFTVEPLAGFDPSSSGSLPRIRPTDIESSYNQFATNLAGDSGTVPDQVARLAKRLHDGYTLNSQDPGGVQQSLVGDFLRDTKVGSAEQFVTGFVLMARSLGVDARVATGYVLDAQSTSADITTADADVWAEVRAAAGWVEVDVLPQDTSVKEPRPSAAGRGETPPAAQPLERPQVDQAKPNDPVDAASLPPTAGAWAAVRVWAVRGGVAAGLLIWPVVLFAVIVMWKKLRRRRGLKSSDPAQRVSTAWTLATDALVDAGARLHNSQTNAELVEAGVVTQPDAGAPLGRLQRHADAVVFTSAECGPDRAADAVDQLHLIEASIRRSSSRWWRWKWQLSTRSLRRRTQSPLR